MASCAALIILLKAWYSTLNPPPIKRKERKILGAGPKIL
jgi:hypothetical protein